MQNQAPRFPRIAIRRSRWRGHALSELALLVGAVCSSALAGTSQETAVPPAGASSAAGAAGADALHVPASWQGTLPGADGAVLWHLDLLAEQRYRLRRTYEGKPAPNRFDEIGRWAHAVDSSRLDLYVAGEQRIQFLIEADGSLRKLDAAGKPIASGLSYRLGRLPQPELIEPHLKLSGLFIYMADAAVITLCADGSRLPVAMEGDFRALQAAYQKARPAPGQALLASVEGRIASRPSMEETAPPLDTLVVERFISMSPQGSCRGASDNRPLRGTNWQLVRLGEAPVEVSAGQPQPYLVFASDALQVSGSGGCNRITGGFTLEGDRVHLGPLAGTMMACVNGMEQEQRFLKTLNHVKRYRISGEQLDLLGADGTVLATFSARSHSLAGTSWHVTGINNGRGGVVSLVAGTSVTMNFAPDGKVAGSGGCNNYTSTYTQDGDKLTFTSAAATRRMCIASGVMEQEQAFFNALESAVTAQMAGNQLELRKADGALALSLERSPGP